MNVIHPMRFLSILCLLFANAVAAYAQEFPVQVTPVLTPPFSLYLSDYASPEGNLQLIIQLRELDRPEYRVKLRLTIEGQGITIRTKGNYLPRPLVLQGGVTEFLTGADIKNYFDPDNLDFTGISKAEFIKKGALPEGFYTFRFEAVDYVRNVIVSNPGFANAWLILNDPPIINLPFNNDKVVATDPQNVTFSWTPRHTASPNAAFTTEYEFTMIELYPDNRNPNDAIRVGRPIFVTETALTSLNYGMTETLLIPGRKYAFRVRAYDTEGRDLFKNNGYSEVFVFQFGDACIPPTGVKAQALDEGRFKLTWEESAIHTGYAFQFRKSGSSNWNDEKAMSTSAMVPGLQPATTYEYRVRATCGTIQGEYSAIASVKTLESDPTEFACGVPPAAIDINTVPLEGGLKVLDVIKTADFDVIVTEVEENPDKSFRGKGKAMMPWFKLATVQVKFRDIKVNKDFRVYSGNVTTVYTKSSRFIANIDLNNEENDGEDTDGDGTPDIEEDDFVIPDTVTVPVDIEEITVDITNNPDVIVIVAEDGTTQEIPREKDDEGNYTDTVVKDSNGDTWVVGKDGKVSEGPSSGAPDALASLDEVDYSITFEGTADQQYGLDKKGDDSYGEYETATIRDEEYVVPWKSVETGRQDRVAVIAGDESTFPSAVGFKISGADAPAQPSSDASKKEVFITGKSGGLEESLSAYVMVKESDDDEPQEVEIGKLNIATYDKVRRKVFLVPVNNAQGMPSAASVQTELNRIYKQAVVEWDVELAPNFIYDEDVKGIDSDESDFLSSFPGRMQELNRTFANTTWVDANSYYLFFLNGTESRRTGFMPFKRKYGYIYLDRIGTKDTPERVVAHELGHGAFRLRHTFSPEEKKANEGSTDNLMDYNRGSRLKKYQWDLVRHPDNFNGWLEDDQESGSEVKYFSVSMSSQVNLQELGFTSDVNYVAPDGSIITLPLSATVSFTGVTHNEHLDKTVAKGTLLAFVADGKSYVSRYKASEEKWLFDGYVEYTTYATDNYYPGKSGNSSVQSVLIGIEGENCSLELFSGTFDGKPYLEKARLTIKEGVLTIASAKPIGKITMPDCDLVYKTASAKYFASEGLRVHGESSRSTVKEIAGIIDRLGDNWFAEFKEIHKEPRWPSPNVKYINVLSSYAKAEDLQDFLNTLKSYEANKLSNFNSVEKLTDQDELLTLLKGFSIHDFKNLSLAQRKHILSTLAKGELGGTYFKMNGEGIALRVLSTTSDPSSATDLLTYMESTTVDDKVLAVKLMQRIDDGILGFIGGDNYKQLMTEYSGLVMRSNKFEEKIKNLLEVNFTERLIHWEIKQDRSVGAIVSFYLIDDKGVITITRSEITAYDTVKIESETIPTPKYNHLDPVKLNPFDLVAFVNLGSLDVINEASGVARGEMAIVPAVFLQYAKQKLTNDLAASAATLAIDAVTLVTTAGTLTAATNLSKLRRAWLLFEAVNSTISITINLSGLSKDPQWKPVIDSYNYVTCLLSIGELTYTGARNIGPILSKVSKAGAASADVIKLHAQKFYNALKAIDPSKLTANARKAYDKLLEVAASLKIKYGLIDDLIDIGAARLKSSVLSKIALNSNYLLRWTDDELKAFVAFGKDLKLADNDIEAFILAHCRRYQDATLEDMKKVMQSIAAKSASNTIGFKSPYTMLSAYREAQIKMAAGGVLDPKTYLTDSYISSHLQSFHSKASYFVNQSSYDRRIRGATSVGIPTDNPPSLYISSARIADEVVSQAGKDLAAYERLLGFSEGHFSSGKQIWRIDIKDPHNFNLRMPTGAETGANHWWHPGGFTSGGTIEAVIGVVQKEMNGIKYVVEEALIK